MEEFADGAVLRSGSLGRTTAHEQRTILVLRIPDVALYPPSPYYITVRQKLLGNRMLVSKNGDWGWKIIGTAVQPTRRNGANLFDWPRLLLGWDVLMSLGLANVQCIGDAAEDVTDRVT